MWLNPKAKSYCRTFGRREAISPDESHPRLFPRVSRQLLGGRCYGLGLKPSSTLGSARRKFCYPKLFSGWHLLLHDPAFTAPRSLCMC